MTPNESFRQRFGRDLPAWDMRSPNYDYKVKLAMQREARKDYWKYIEECKKQYPGGSLST